MEAAGALDRRGLSPYLEAVQEWVSSRSRAFWIVAGLTVVAAALRFATLGTQSYHHDEVITASRLLRGSFGHAMDAVGFSESAPPLYYVLAWLWVQLMGNGEVGLRSLSALAGVATVPVAYLIGTELRDRAAGIAAAALVAVNPMLLWYSQEARAYALLVLLTSISFLYFVRALRDVPSVEHPYGGVTHGTSFRRRAVVLWGVFSGLALATHYFAFFPLAAEAVWLLRRHGRAAVRGVAIVIAFGLALAPLVAHQMSYAHAEWISNFSLGHRLWEAGVTFMVGETGDVIAQPEHPLFALAPALLAIGAPVLVMRRGDGGDRRAAGIPLAIAVATVAAPLAIALVDPGEDFVLARNLMPALVPLLVAVGVGCTLPAARRTGALLGAALVVYSLGFSVWASVSPALQRPDWDAIAAELGEPAAPRAMVTWTIGAAPLRYYLSTGAYQPRPSEGFAWWVGEVDFISRGEAPPPPARLLGPGFRQAAYEQVGRFWVRRYVWNASGLGYLRLEAVSRASLGFRSNRVLLDGIGPE
ncbi:MAG TPA: glycosyltransferase family 39 protein [Solirubrobacterales bacterium]